VRTYQGIIRQVQLDHWGRAGAGIACPQAAIPAPGQYLLARAIDDREAVLGTALFTAGGDGDGFLAAPPIPSVWEPGTRLELRGPIGRGLRLPDHTRRLALLALGETPARLLPFAALALDRPETSVALFTDASLPWLPAGSVSSKPGRLASQEIGSSAGDGTITSGKKKESPPAMTLMTLLLTTRP